MSNPIEFEGRLWRRIKENEWESLIGKPVLIHNTGERGMCIRELEGIFPNANHIVLIYDSQTPWGTFQATIPRTNTHSIVKFYCEEGIESYSSRCYCGGPSEERWCYDTQKVEPICVYCRRRK